MRGEYNGCPQVLYRWIKNWCRLCWKGFWGKLFNLYVGFVCSWCCCLVMVKTSLSDHLAQITYIWRTWLFSPGLCGLSVLLATGSLFLLNLGSITLLFLNPVYDRILRFSHLIVITMLLLSNGQDILVWSLKAYLHNESANIIHISSLLHFS